MEIVKKATHQMSEKVAEKVEYISTLDPGIDNFKDNNDIHGRNNTVAKNAKIKQLSEERKDSNKNEQKQEDTKNFLDKKNQEFSKKLKKTRVDMKQRNQIEQDTRKLE